MVLVSNATSVCVKWVGRKECAKHACLVKTKLKSHVKELMSIICPNPPMNTLINVWHNCGASVETHVHYFSSILGSFNNWTPKSSLSFHFETHVNEKIQQG